MDNDSGKKRRSLYSRNPEEDRLLKLFEEIASHSYGKNIMDFKALGIDIGALSKFQIQMLRV